MDGLHRLFSSRACELDFSNLAGIDDDRVMLTSYDCCVGARERGHNLLATLGHFHCPLFSSAFSNKPATFVNFLHKTTIDICV